MKVTDKKFWRALGEKVALVAVEAARLGVDATGFGLRGLKKGLFALSALASARRTRREEPFIQKYYYTNVGLSLIATMKRTADERINPECVVESEQKEPSVIAGCDKTKTVTPPYIYNQDMIMKLFALGQQPARPTRNVGAVRHQSNGEPSGTA